jgi:hypothetical protein
MLSFLKIISTRMYRIIVHLLEIVFVKCAMVAFLNKKRCYGIKPITANGKCLGDKSKHLKSDENYYPGHIRSKQATFIGRLRRLFAVICLHTLEPDIIIIDKS